MGKGGEMVRGRGRGSTEERERGVGNVKCMGWRTEKGRGKEGNIRGKGRGRNRERKGEKGKAQG